MRDVSLASLEKYDSNLPEIVRRRCRHVVNENLRVMRAADAFEKSDLDLVGRLMADSHASLRDEFEVSCHELDVMVDLARDIEGAYGARMTGGGFGGCTVNLVREDKVADFQRQVGAEYEQRTGNVAEIYVSAAADGASRIA